MIAARTSGFIALGLVSLVAAGASAQTAPYPYPPPPPPPVYGPSGPQPGYPPPQPGYPPPPPGPGEVSQINGQLVPVGQHNEYVYSFPRWNISANPLGWVFGSYGVSVSYGIHQNFAVRGDVNYYRPINTSVSGFEIGAGLPIYFRRTYSGVFLEPGLIVRQLKEDGGTSSTVVGPEILVGWHWLWDSGLNVAIAAGAGRNWSTQQLHDAGTAGDEIFFNGYLRFGYAFN